MNKLTYGRLCELAQRHGVKITENVRAFVREVEEEDRRAREDARPVLWWNGIRKGEAGDFVGPSFSEKEDTNHDIPLVSAVNPCNYTHPEASAPGLSDDERAAVAGAIESITTNGAHIDLNIVRALQGLLTRASAATVAEPSGGTPDTYPARLLHESDASLAERVDSWHKRHPQAAQQQAEPSTAFVSVGDGRIWDGEKWLHIAPGMETYALLDVLRKTAQHKPETSTYERSQQLAVFLRLAEVVQADAKRTRDRYPAQSERADQLAAFMKTACKWAAQSVLPAALPDGCKLVPKEPTDAMLDRGAAAVVAAKKIPMTGYGIAAHAWSAMYAAATQQEATK